MNKSDTILMQFCHRLHGDESDPIGSNFAIDQIGTRELHVKVGDKKILFEATDNVTIRTPERNVKAESTSLSDELYNKFCEEILAELRN